MDSAAQPEDTAVTTNDRTVTEHSEHEESFEYHEYHDFSSEDASAKMHHLMHSDTIIVVVSLFVMIVLGLVFRKCCMKLSTVNSRKKRIQGGLRQIGEHMNYVTRSMSNDLELPDSPRQVIRTYSNYGKRGEEGEEGNSPGSPGSPGSSPGQPRRGQHTNSLLVQAISNSASKEEMELATISRALDRIDLESQSRAER